MAGQASSPFTVTMSPAKQTVAAGVTKATKFVKVGDHGTEAVTVTTRELTLHQAGGSCGIGQGNGWLAFSPAAFSLQPGQVKTVAVHVNAPAGAPTTDLLAVFTASGHAATAAHSGGSVAGAVASQVEVLGSGTGKAPRCGHQPKAVAPGHSGLTSFDMTAGGLVLLVVVLVTAAVMAGRRHGRHA